MVNCDERLHSKGTESVSAPKLVPACKRLTAYRPRKWCGVGLSVSTVAPGRFQDISECPRRDRAAGRDASGALSRGNLLVILPLIVLNVCEIHYALSWRTTRAASKMSIECACSRHRFKLACSFRRRGAGRAGLILAARLALRWGRRGGRP